MTNVFSVFPHCSGTPSIARRKLGRALLVLTTWACMSFAHASDVLDALEVGHWVEVRGSLDKGRFEASRVQLRQPGRRQELWGVAKPGTLPGSVQVLGRQIVINSATRGSRSPERLLGKRLRIKGHLTRDGDFVARRIEQKSRGSSRIRGRIDHIRTRQDGRLYLEIAGFDVHVSSTARATARVWPADAERILPMVPASAASEIADLDDVLGEGWNIGSALHFGLQQKFAIRDLNNLELDDPADEDVDADDDLRESQLQTRARLTWFPSDRLVGVLDAQFEKRFERLRKSNSSSDSDVRLRSAYLLWRDLPIGGDLAMGRQDFDDPREWIYDADLDAVRYFRQTGNLNWELSWSRILGDASDREESSNNLIAQVSNRHGDAHRAFYVINRRFDASGSGESRGDNLTHTGIRTFEPLGDSFRSWLDLSRLDGRRRDARVAAWAVDAGLRWSSEHRDPWRITAGYAWSSGDRGAGKDTAFRQTGLQDNSGRLGGVSPVRYYGEVLDPELANLQVATLSVARHFAGRNSIELIGHRYTQTVASRRLRNTGISRSPNGRSRDIGWAGDIAVSFREHRHWELTLIGGWFQPGKAFDDAEPAWLAEIQTRFRF